MDPIRLLRTPFYQKKKKQLPKSVPTFLVKNTPNLKILNKGNIIIIKIEKIKLRKTKYEKIN